MRFLIIAAESGALILLHRNDTDAAPADTAAGERADASQHAPFVSTLYHYSEMNVGAPVRLRCRDGLHVVFHAVRRASSVRPVPGRRGPGGGGAVLMPVVAVGRRRPATLHARVQRGAARRAARGPAAHHERPAPPVRRPVPRRRPPEHIVRGPARVGRRP